MSFHLKTIVDITFEIMRRTIFWSDIPYEWYRLINKKSKIYHFIWQSAMKQHNIYITFDMYLFIFAQ